MEIDFDFIKKVGDEVRNLFLNDPDVSDWFYNIIEEYNENNDFPPDLVSIVIDKINLTGDEYRKKLVSDIQAIIQEEENIENLLNFIFYPVSIGEEEEEEADDINSKSLSLEVDNNDDDDDDDDDTDEDLKIINPEEYFDKIVKKIMNILALSHDISYVLCKKFNLSKDIICQQWISSRDEILKSLRIKIGSEMVPTTKSPLTIKSIGVDECPICTEETEIFQLYCGHKLCKDCLALEIKTLLSDNQIPVCRQQYEEDDNKLCNSEIMANDVKNFLNDDKLFKKYNKILLDKETSVYQGVRRCPNEYCDAVITPLNEIQCHVGRCPQCGGFVCLKCRQECHAPIIDCAKVDHFMVTLADSMRELKENQAKWVKREKKLRNYRFNHKKEYHSAYNEIIQKLKTSYREKNRKELEKMDEIHSLLHATERKIVILRKRKFNENLTESETKAIDIEINALQSEYNKDEVVLKRLQAESQNNQDNLVKELEFYENEEKLLDLSYSSPLEVDINFFKYDVAMNEHAVSRIKFLSQDWIQSKQMKEQNDKSTELVICGIYKKCPRCKTPIERISGCNHMTCTVCECQFCYICGDFWSRHINYICPKYGLDNDFRKNNVNENKKVKNKKKIDREKECNFYMPPMSIEKRVEYFRWNNSYSQFQVQKEKYEEAFRDFKNKKNLKPETGEFINSDKKLCTRNKIAKILLKDVERSKVKMKTYSILNEILFANSVVMWGYPALYYMMHNPHKAMLFEYKLLLLEEASDKFIDLLHNPGDSSSKDLDTNVKIIDRQIADILSIAEEF